MAQVINTNIASLTAQRNLATSQKDAATAMQRLSSGLRINSAKDDAAGLGIASRLTSQINGINQAIRNANDGLSVAQIAEGALSQTNDLLQRMRELSVQSLNASNSVADREALQIEVQQLYTEISRIASNTAFGESKLLNGNFATKSFQVGANAGETIAVTIDSAKAQDLGAQNTLAFTSANFETGRVATAAAKASNSSAVAAQTLTFTSGPSGSTVTTNVAVGVDDSAADIASAITSDVSGVRAKATTVFRVADGTTGGTYTSGQTVTLEINGVSLSVDAGGSYAAFVDNIITAASQKSGLSNLGFVDGTTYLEIADTSGGDVTFGLVSDGTATARVDIDAYTDTAANSGAAISSTQAINDMVVTEHTTVTGSVSLFAEDATDIHTVKSSTAIGATGIASATAVTGTITAGTSRIDDVNVSTVAGAETALDLIDSALSTIAKQRAELGAIQSRFDMVISNLSNVSENSLAAKSRIIDADFASETAQLAKSQILQQAGISVLAQANAQPQNVLALLQ